MQHAVAGVNFCSLAMIHLAEMLTSWMSPSPLTLSSLSVGQVLDVDALRGKGGN